MNSSAFLFSSTKLKPRNVESGGHIGDGQSRFSRKRKRCTEHQSGRALDQTDFGHAASPGRDDAVSGSSVAPGTQNSSQESHFLEEPQASSRDRKNFLQNHKVKVTHLLDGSDGRLSTKDGDKKRKRSPTVKALKPSSLPEPLKDFGDLERKYGVSRCIIESLAKQQFVTPTEVQLAGLPLLLGFNQHKSSRDKSENPYGSEPSTPWGPACDLLSVAPTGSGKTLAFMVPMVHTLQQQAKAVSARTQQGASALILAPTKELARQITNEGNKLVQNTGIKITLVRKGMNLEHNRSSGLAEQGTDERDKDERAKDERPAVKADILVSTPLAFLNAVCIAADGKLDLPHITNLVLDEADVLLDPLFRDQTMKIWSACSNQSLRTSLWSATMGSNIEELTTSVIREKRRQSQKLTSVASYQPPLARLIVGLKGSSVPKIEHRLIYTASEQGKLTTFRQLLRGSTSSHALLSSLSQSRFYPPFLVFTQTIPRAVALHAELIYDFTKEAGGSSRIAVLHADLSDTAREKVMDNFRRGEIWILITTDLLARGVDFKGVNAVINYDLPNSSAAYIHRVGRTGRAGREGSVAVTLYSKEDLPYVKNVANVIAAGESHQRDPVSSENQWILDSLPRPTKGEKKQLKRRGVDSRRTGRARDDQGRLRNAKSQISTRSGFLRHLENNKRGLMDKTRRPDRASSSSVAKAKEDDSFSGFSDSDSA